MRPKGNLSIVTYPDPRTREGTCPECGTKIKFWMVGNQPMNSHKGAGRIACKIAVNKRIQEENSGSKP